MVRKFICMALELAGHQCYAAANGLEALALFRSNANSIDVIVMDMVMPVMTGPQAAARIRETKPDVPLICISGYSEEQAPKNAYVLQKPFAPSALVALVNQIVNR